MADCARHSFSDGGSQQGICSFHLVVLQFIIHVIILKGRNGIEELNKKKPLRQQWF